MIDKDSSLAAQGIWPFSRNKKHSHINQLKNSSASRSEQNVVIDPAWNYNVSWRLLSIGIIFNKLTSGMIGSYCHTPRETLLKSPALYLAAVRLWRSGNILLYPQNGTCHRWRRFQNVPYPAPLIIFAISNPHCSSRSRYLSFLICPFWRAIFGKCRWSDLRTQDRLFVR